MTENRLTESIENALIVLEKNGEIMLIGSSIEKLSEFITEKVLEVVPSPSFSHEDMSKIKSLLIHLTYGPAFYPEDLPAVTGATLEDFQAIAGRLPLPE